MIDKHTALIYTMVMISAADANMSDAELRTIGRVVDYMPVFQGFDFESLSSVAAECAEMLQNDDGLDRALDVIKSSLSPALRETAYAVACDVAASDGQVKQEELRLLEIMRDSLEIDRLTAAAIERGARARFTKN